MRIMLRLLLVALSLCIAQAGFAQGKTISGRVTSSEDGSALPGVSVVVKGTTNGASTDIDGRYTIQAAAGNVLVFSYIGMQAQEQTVGTADVIHIALRADATSMEEVVVVGYGTQMKSNVTGAISTVSKEVLESRPIPDVARGLQGTVPGLTITTPSGQIGAAPSIKLRGFTGTLNSGGAGAQPLILVDNVEFPDLQLINPEDIESISVLKDAASSSIYGTRGAWGVILITTKSGKRGAPTRVTYSNNFAWSTPAQTPELAPAVEGAEMAFLAKRRTNPSATTLSAAGVRVDQQSLEKIRQYRDLYGDGSQFGKEMVEGRDYDIRDGFMYFYRPWDPGEMFMEKWAPQQNHNLSISGGSEKTNYNFSAGYLGQQGVYKVNPDDFKRYNLNLGVNTSVTSWLDARAKVLYTKSSLTQPFMFSSATYDFWHYLYRWPAISPYGTIDGKPFRNAITEVEQAKLTEDNTDFTRINIGGTFKPLKGLTVDVDYTFGSTNGHYNETGGSVTALNHWNGLINGQLAYQTYTGASYDRVAYLSSWNNRHTGKAFATYVKDINKHSFKVIAGSDIETYEAWSQRSQALGLMDPNLGEIKLATGAQTVDGSHSQWSTLGFFGRVNYVFNNKYLLEVNARYDGSSRLSPLDKWGFFPSVSAGYVVSEEPFMEFARPVLSFLKVRGSWGSIGNQSTSPGDIYALMSRMSTGSGWSVGGVNLPSLNVYGSFNPLLTWETITTLDFGLDTRFLNDRLGIAFDWYSRRTTDMFGGGVPVPSTLGVAAPRINFGELETKGWELAVDFKQSFSNGLNINATAALSDFKEEIIKFGDTRLYSGNYEGKILGEIWGYETDRFFTEDDFVKDANGNFVEVAGKPGKYKLKEGIADQARWEVAPLYFGPGDVKYKDLNGDGVINDGDGSIDNPGDRKVIGNTTPRYQYSLRLGADFKGFDMSIFLQGVGSRDYWAIGSMYQPGWRTDEAWYAHQLDYWTPENPNAFYPRPSPVGEATAAVGGNFNFKPQSKYLLDLSYLRVKNIAIGYTIPKSITNKAKVERLRIYVSGENLFTFDKLDGVPIDPEINVTTANANDLTGVGRVYPYRSSYSVGVQITL